MWHSNRIISRTRISLILLLAISIRLVPFGLLHYHYNKFASFERASVSVGHDTTTLEEIGDEGQLCTLDQFLSLTNNSFVLSIGNKLLDPQGINIAPTLLIEATTTYLFFDILNKGSPMPV